jgi:hypothetical protein
MSKRVSYLGVANIGMSPAWRPRNSTVHDLGRIKSACTETFFTLRKPKGNCQTARFWRSDNLYVLTRLTHLVT